jgi:flagellar L-ring protein precursor FlgH
MLVFAVAWVGPAARAQDPPGGAPVQEARGSRDRALPPSSNYEELYTRYLAAARAMHAGTPAGGSAWMAALALDPRAKQVNDLVTVRIVESIAATGTADSALTKNSSGSASVTKFFGLDTKFPDVLDPTNLANPSSDTKFKGGGTTTRSGELTATMTARVVDVLPNGDLVLEGAREIDINGDRQVVVLTGVVRPNAINRSNIVPSTQVGQLRIQYFGRGLIKDNLKPGLLIRILNKIF